jgi:TrmH RNA methyltransferase
MKPREITICGLAAVTAQFEKAPRSIKRLFFDLPTGRKVGAISKALARDKKVYRCVDRAELEKIAGSKHHGGIVAVVDAPEAAAPSEHAVQEWARRGEPLLVLDRVGNAHNLGAIARTAAFFGVPRIVVPDDPAAALPGDAAHRVAEGGLAHVEILRAKSLTGFLQELSRAGYDVIGAATRGGRAGEGPRATKPVAIVMGNEETGLSLPVAAACGRLVTLPGTGKVESLNVSVAAAILIWELWARGRRG